MFTVTTPHDSESGSLREAIIQANQDPNPPIYINFDICPGAIQFIKLKSGLPDITAPYITLNATSQPRLLYRY